MPRCCRISFRNVTCPRDVTVSVFIATNPRSTCPIHCNANVPYRQTHRSVPSRSAGFSDECIISPPLRCAVSRFEVPGGPRERGWAVGYGRRYWPGYAPHIKERILGEAGCIPLPKPENRSFVGQWFDNRILLEKK